MRYGTRNVWSRFRAGSLKTVASELAKYNLDLVAVQEVRWVEGSSRPAEDYTHLSVEMGVLIITWEQAFRT